MPLDDIDDLIDHTLDDYLLALAQSIQQAQRQLDQLTVPGLPGQPTIAYHLPRVEFELKMTFSMSGQQGAGGSGGSASLQSAKAGGGAGGAGGTGGAVARPASKMLWRPVSPGSAESYSGEATSIIRGSFVAVPVAAGRPPALVRCSLSRKNATDVGLLVQVTDALGAPQADVEVQLNVDRERSAELGTPAGRALSAETNVLAGVVRTDAAGRAETTLHIAASEPGGTVVVVTIDALGVTDTVMVQVPPSSSNPAPGPAPGPTRYPNPRFEEM